jgi:hypothetical protein
MRKARQDDGCAPLFEVGLCLQEAVDAIEAGIKAIGESLAKGSDLAIRLVAEQPEDEGRH